MKIASPSEFQPGDVMDGIGEVVEVGSAWQTFLGRHRDVTFDVGDRTKTLQMKEPFPEPLEITRQPAYQPLPDDFYAYEEVNG